MAEDWGYQILPYTGDGVNGRQVTTAFPLNSGRVAVFIYPYPTGGACMRHSSVATTFIDGSTTASTTSILAFNATGFTLGTTGGVFTRFNTLGSTYIAIVLRDLTAAGDYMQVGTYAGSGVDNRAVSTTFSPTHVWVAGRTFIYRSTDFTGNAAIPLNDDPATLLSGTIKSFSATGFTVGTVIDVNELGRDYGFVAFQASAAFLAAGFYSFKSTGTAAVGDAVTYGFAPVFTIARRFTAGSLNAPRWRSTCSHTGVQSEIAVAAGNSPTVDTTGGVRSLDANGATFGDNVAFNGVDFYGFAFAGDGVSCGFTNSGFLPTAGGEAIMNPGADSGGGAGCINTLPTGSDTGGGAGCQVLL